MGPAVQPCIRRITAGSCKPSKAKQLTKVFSRLEQLLLSEWSSIRSANLGVKSGTSILEDVLLLQLNQLATQLHTLAVSDQEAASRLVGLAGKLDEQHFQQLQVLLDVLGHEELSDYLALLVGQQTGRGSGSSKGYSAASATAAAVSLTSSSGNGALTASQLRGASSIGSKLLPGCEGGSAAGPGWQRRTRAAAGVAFDMAAFGSVRDSSSQRRSMGSSSCPDLTSLRFACLLPPGHLLTKTAEQLQRQQEFETALQASKAAAAAAAAAVRAQQRVQAVSMLQLPGKLVPRYGDAAANRPGSGNSCSSFQCSSSPTGGMASPFRWAGHNDPSSNLGFSLTGLGAMQSDRGGLLAEPDSMPGPLSHAFRAPGQSVEQIWKEGRKATTEAVLGAAHLQLHDGPFGALLLEPSIVLQPRVVQQQTPPVLDAAAGGRLNTARSRRGSVTSRPCSAAAFNGSRRGTRISNIGAVTNASCVDVAAQYGGPLATFGSVMTPSATPNSSGGSDEAARQMGRQGAAAGESGSPCLRASMWEASPLAAMGSSRSGCSAATGYASSSESPCSNSSSTPSPFRGEFDSGIQAASAGPGRRMAIAGPRAAGINLLDPAGSAYGAGGGAPAAGYAKAGVPALQLSRLGSMHAPGSLHAPAAAAGALTARPDSAGSSSTSRPDSAASSSRLAVSARAGGAGGAGGLQHLVQ